MDQNQTRSTTKDTRQTNRKKKTVIKKTIKNNKKKNNKNNNKNKKKINNNKNDTIPAPNYFDSFFKYLDVYIRNPISGWLDPLPHYPSPSLSPSLSPSSPFSH